MICFVSAGHPKKLLYYSEVKVWHYKHKNTITDRGSTATHSKAIVSKYSIKYGRIGLDPT